MERGEWIFEPAVWPASTLWFLYPDRWYSIWISWHATGELWGWYVNFQRPLIRVGHRIHTMDQALDMVVDLDLGWRWKDQSEYEYYRQRGLIPDGDAGLIDTASQEVIELLDRSGPPFSEGWDRWKPDPRWALPQLPADWQSLA